MNSKPIKTKSDSRAALTTIDSLMTARPNTPEGEHLDAFVTLVEAY
jgi:HTH-type transcriptional regulator / antitoxin HigA